MFEIDQIAIRLSSDKKSLLFPTRHPKNLYESVTPRAEHRVARADFRLDLSSPLFFPSMSVCLALVHNFSERRLDHLIAYMN